MRASLVLIPQIETDVVGMQHWLSQAFADGVVMGQIPLGPVLIVATSMGCKVERRVAAAVATVGALLPSFVMTLIAALWSLNRFRSNHQVQAFLSGVVPAVVGMLAAAGVSLARSGLDSALSFGVATIAFLLMLRAKLNPVVIVVGCGALQFAVAHHLF